MSAEDNLIRLVMEKGSLDELDALRNLYAGLRMHNEGMHQDKVAQSNLQVQFGLASNDRDARRRRMELAALILDYERTLPLEEVSAVLLGTSVAVPRKDYDYYTSRDYHHLRTVGFPAHNHVWDNGQCTVCYAEQPFSVSRPAYNTPSGQSSLPDITSIPTPKCLECGYTGPYCQEPGTLHEVSCSLYRAPRG